MMIIIIIKMYTHVYLGSHLISIWFQEKLAVSVTIKITSYY